MIFEHHLPLAALVAFTLVVNLPFGFLRSRVDRYSLLWFLYIHLPIPFLFFFRRMLMLTPFVVPLLVLAAILGQVCGGRLKRKKSG